MQLTANLSKELTQFRSKEYNQEIDDSDWCGYTPIIKTEFRNIKLSSYITNNKMYSDTKCETSEVLINIDNKLERISVDTGVFTNIGDLYKKTSFGNLTQGEYLNIPYTPEQLKVLEFNINFKQQKCFIFGTEDLFNDGLTYFQFGILENGNIGLGYGTSDMSIDSIVNIFNENDTYKIKVIHDQNVLSVFVDDVLLISKTNLDVLPNRNITIFDNNYYNSTDEYGDNIIKYPVLGYCTNFMASNNIIEKYVHSVSTDSIDTNVIINPVDFTLQTMLGLELDQFNGITSRFENIKEINILESTEDMYLCDVIYNDVNRSGRKIIYQVNMANSSNSPEFNNIITNIEYKTYKKVLAQTTCIIDEPIVIEL